jgi:IS1 family transposase
MSELDDAIVFLMDHSYGAFAGHWDKINLILDAAKRTAVAEKENAALREKLVKLEKASEALKEWIENHSGSLLLPDEFKKWYIKAKHSLSEIGDEK